MYSYEEHIRAVKLYIKLEKRLRATIRQLGYSTKNSLIGWYREHERDCDLQVSYGSYLGEISPAPESLINRNSHAVIPNEKWLTDITEFQIPVGKVYL